MSARIPVTVLTGFLGAGKTTLVNRILSENHGKRIAVIENEFGEVGVDHELVIGTNEEIFETSNGCICCTVRGDLIRILLQLRKRRERFDSILIETTGLADPGPVAQTFFIDEDLKQHFVLDAIVTLVDALHVEKELQDSAIALEQIGFADTILLNKTDLVDTAALARIERQLRSINATAAIVRTRNADVPLQRVLNVGAFDLERALQRDATFLDTVRPFEWAGVYQLTVGTPVLHAGAHAAAAHAHDSDHDHDDGHEHSHTHELALDHVDVLLLPVADDSAEALEPVIEAASKLFTDEPVPVEGGAVLQPQRLYRLKLKSSPEFPLQIERGGTYALFTEHAPEEFNMHLHAPEPLQQRSFGSVHHDLDVRSVGLTDERALDTAKVNEWLSYLLQSHGEDILRMKGVLNLKGENRRYVFHGVHMMFDGQLERPWPENAPRVSRLVFIGRNLDRQELEAGFESCVA